MDDFGNDYQTEAGFYGCDGFIHSASTFGMMDDAAIDICIWHCIDYGAVDI